jgi:hypothetical protein
MINKITDEFLLQSCIFSKYDTRFYILPSLFNFERVIMQVAKEFTEDHKKHMV